MLKYIPFRNIKLAYTDEGSGFPVILLHGYLESSEIWEPFSAMLKSQFRVISVDLPGHGKSGIIEKIHSMELLAESVAYVCKEEKIDKCVLVGHSMGGYVTLAFAEKYHEMLAGFSLFHSAPFADSEEKKANRDREIELVKQGKKDLIINVNIPNIFANDNLEPLSLQIEKAKVIARKTPDKGIIAILEGMKLRPDRNSVIKNTQIPFLWILGKKDNHILFDTIKDRIQMNKNGETAVLDNSGHIGFIEETEKAFKIMESFIHLCAEKR